MKEAPSEKVVLSDFKTTRGDSITIFNGKSVS